MKRYECTGYYENADMHECSNGQWYSRADLIAAGVLVPVPDGPKLPRGSAAGKTVMCKDNDGCFTTWNIWHPIPHPHDTIVQPVRLVRLEDE